MNRGKLCLYQGIIEMTLLIFFLYFQFSKQGNPIPLLRVSYLICHLRSIVKGLVFKTPPPTLEILRVRVEDALQALKNDREMIRRAVGGLMNRANTCLERNGSHVEGY